MHVHVHCEIHEAPGGFELSRAQKELLKKGNGRGVTLQIDPTKPLNDKELEERLNRMHHARPAKQVSPLVQAAPPSNTESADPSRASIKGPDGKIDKDLARARHLARLEACKAARAAAIQPLILAGLTANGKPLDLSKSLEENGVDPKTVLRARLVIR